MHKKITIVLLVLGIILLIATDANSQATKKVTYGKSTFTIYEPLNLPPTPTTGFRPEVPGHNLKTNLYGPGTYYRYAPGNVRKTNYKCLLNELQDWIFYRPDYVKKHFADKGYTPVNEKDIKKMGGKTRLPNSGIMYKIGNKKWLHFHVVGLQNCGPMPWGSNEEHIMQVALIEEITFNADSVLDRIYRFWNDGVRFTDYAEVGQSNFHARPTPPQAKNPNFFSIGDVLKPEKGFYSLTFENGPEPTYLWHSYANLVTSNLKSKKKDFDANGIAGFNDLYAAFQYQFDIIQVKDKLYVMYLAKEMMCHDLVPGVSWQQEMKTAEEGEKQRAESERQLKKEYDKSLEMYYKEVFK
jgi:hypothetical protein